MSEYKNQFFGHILVADDSLINQEVINMQLKKLGVSFEIVSNGKQAIDILLTSPITSIVITDLNMPFVDGFKLTKFIRSKEYLNEIIIIGLTAELSYLSSDIINEHGFDCIIKKPCSLKELKILLSQNSDIEIHKPNWLLNFPKSSWEQIITIFNTSMTNDLINLRKQKDFEKIKNTIHKIKGCAAIIGWHELVVNCKIDSNTSNVKLKKQALNIQCLITNEIKNLYHWTRRNEKQRP
ncbi:response regulator [Vibrio sp. M250220]|uniref:response regulator n=1 Tax=Vibrio sp. M250220 TaxID=3020894 RepID=UPI002F40028C